MSLCLACCSRNCVCPGNCPRIAAAYANQGGFLNVQPHMTEAMREGQSQAARLDAALRRIEGLARDVALDRAEAIKSEKRLEALESCAVGTSGSLIDTRRRIEALELEVAKLKGPLPGGVWSEMPLTVTKVDVENGRVELRALQASPATAYPPMPDEGT